VSNQYVTDHFPTAIAPKEAWPTMPADAYTGLPGEVTRPIEPHADSDVLAHLRQSLASLERRRSRALPVEGDRHFTVLNVVLAGDTGFGR
jgi:hypothetical protein